MSTKKMVLPASIGLAVLSFVILAQVAGATHPRPLSASPLRVPLVPAYEECTSPNRTHGPPLAFPSCSPPVQSSKFLTVGTSDANGAEAMSVGSFTLRVNPASTDNVVITGSISDVRCKPGATPCGNANAADGPDYTGELKADMTVRISDHNNAVDPGGGTDAATVVDIPSPASMFCASTADTSIGSRCSIAIPGPCPPRGCSTLDNGDRTVVGVKQVQVFDGGQDGLAGTAGNMLFMEQGVFIP